MVDIYFSFPIKVSQPILYFWKFQTYLGSYTCNSKEWSLIKSYFAAIFPFWASGEGDRASNWFALPHLPSWFHHYVFISPAAFLALIHFDSKYYFTSLPVHIHSSYLFMNNNVAKCSNMSIKHGLLNFHISPTGQKSFQYREMCQPAHEAKNKTSFESVFSARQCTWCSVP